MTTTRMLEIECEFAGTCSNPALPRWHNAHYVHGITVRAVLELQLTPEHTEEDVELRRREFGAALQSWVDGHLRGQDLNGVMRIENMSLERIAVWIYNQWMRHHRDLASVRVQDNQDRSVWVAYRPSDAPMEVRRPAPAA